MTDDHGLARVAGEVDGLAERADEAAFQSALLRLLERRTAIHTQGDSTSVPTHVAADILRSICFVLGIDLEDRVVPDRLLTVDLEQEFGRRLAEVERKVEAAKRLWRDVCVETPLIPNIALRDTLAAIGDFFRDYDHRSLAHEIPCSIDYPVCHQVDESLLGVDWIAEYLRRLMVEARFLQHFDIADCERVLSKASPDYIDLLVNLYEPVAIGAIGLALLGRDPSGLAIGDEEREAIADRLRPLGGEGRARALREAAVAAADSLGVADPSERGYLADVVPDLVTRVGVGLEHGTLSGIFLG